MYSYETVRLVKDRIEKRRLDAIETAEEHAAEVRAISPEIRKIDNELSKTGLAVFRAALDGEDIEPIKERNQRLIARRSEILRELGYPADYSDIHYTCKAVLLPPPRACDRGGARLRHGQAHRAAVIR